MNPGISGPCTAIPTGNRPLHRRVRRCLLPHHRRLSRRDLECGHLHRGAFHFRQSGNRQFVGWLLRPGRIRPAGPRQLHLPGGGPGYQGNPPIIPVDQPFCNKISPGIQRNGNCALDILNVDSATAASSVPEPASLFFSALVGLLFVAKRVRSVYYPGHRY